ncbi:restriction endonuclease [Streptomyces lomondensis]|uniref:restriction endonuclease n=1 Tax=Streptomyces lomondensis TaxID=68229 RepID=UPI001E5D908F|nr:restriction endonuclease [Streptomyces lomondensis]MCF0078100.1 restriction endonuclease [Streptomyces lomondensis]
MVHVRVLRGYLLEEAVAWLLRSSGYELLSAADDKEKHPAHRVLEQRHNGLAVRGRGAWHQADALGQFRYVPPFSLPVRLFVEAKFTDQNVKLPTVRNGHGVVHDVNENVVTSVQGAAPSRPRPRYHYSYAIFSTAGFSRDAQEYALAHQISLVDLSMPDFAGLRHLVSTRAQRVHEALDALPAGQRPRVYEIRSHLRRRLLEVSDDYGSFLYGDTVPELPPSVAQPLDDIAGHLNSPQMPGLVLAFPSAPFVLGLASENLYAFVDHARRHPTHTVHLGRLPQAASHPVWRIRPAEDPGAYAMTFSLPQRVESWIRAQEETVNDRARWIKRNVLSTMTVYWQDGDHTLTFQLRYAPVELRQ